jgi:hypothetical protein
VLVKIKDVHVGRCYRHPSTARDRTIGWILGQAGLDSVSR